MGPVARTLAFIAAGIIGAAAAGAGVLVLMFVVLRLISWLRGNDDCMFYMWFGIAIVPIAALMGFVGAGLFVTERMRPQPANQERRGFDVVVTKPTVVPGADRAEQHL